MEGYFTDGKALYEVTGVREEGGTPARAAQPNYGLGKNPTPAQPAIPGVKYYTLQNAATGYSFEVDENAMSQYVPVQIPELAALDVVKVEPPESLVAKLHHALDDWGHRRPAWMEGD